MNQTRTFIAIRPPTAALEALRHLAHRLQRAPGGDSCRWASEETIHLTIRFLGNVADARLPEVYAATDRATRMARPFRLVLAGVGCFPNPNRPRVVWVGVSDGAHLLVQLATALEEEVTLAGFARDERPFHPHLAVARVRQAALPEQVAALGRTVAAWPVEPLAEIAVGRCYVIGSDLRPSGPVYTMLHESPLVGREQA